MTEVRLVPDGCDYVLRGSLSLGTGSLRDDPVTVQARTADGSTVTVDVPRDAPGVSIVADPHDPEAATLYLRASGWPPSATMLTPGASRGTSMAQRNPG